MPAIYAHNRFGEAVISKLPKKLLDILNQYPEALHLGFQGPDILFYHHPIKKNAVRQIGVDLHHLPAAGFFVEQAKKLYVKDDAGNFTILDSPLTSYIAGFLCHFLLDATTHPLIYQVQATGISHGKIESEFDKYLRRKDGKPIRGYNVAHSFTKENGTAAAVATALGVTDKQAALAIKTMKQINGFFVCKSEAFHALAHLLLKIAGMDRKFGDMFLHKKDDPACKDCNVELTALLENAVSWAAEQVEAYFSSLEEIATTGKMDDFYNKLYTGGTIDANPEI